jgi:hypothetical protein
MEGRQPDHRRFIAEARSEGLKKHGGTESAETHGEEVFVFFSSVRLRDLRVSVLPETSVFPADLEWI